MARIAGVQTIKSPRTGRVQKLVIDVDKALKNEQLSEFVEDLLIRMKLEKRGPEPSKPLEEVINRLDKKHGIKRGKV